MGGFRLTLIFLFCIFCFVKSSKNDDQLQLLDKQIEDLKNQIKLLDKISGGSDAEKAIAWANLGLNLQIKDVGWHVGGRDLQPEALDCFNKALSLADSTDLRLLITVNQHKGILLKMMDRGEESAEAHDLVFDLSTTNYDKSSALFSKGDALAMLGRIEEAIDCYRQALSLRPDQISTYLPLVKSLKELNKMSKSNWKSLLKEMRAELKKVTRGEYDPLEEYGVAVLMKDRNTEITSEIYWALFEAAEKAGEVDFAWKNLEKAHEIQKRKHPPVDESKMSDADSIKKVFQRGFWPVDVGLDTMVPVFIVGMMRSGSTLLETMLDAHPKVFGIGEDSVFNPAIPALRDDLLTVLGTGNPNESKMVKTLVEKHGKQISMKMISIAKNSTQGTSREGKIKRVVDKMLFNYKNIGFIHLVFPNAVILHTVRDPLDTLLSCYKHKFDDSGLEWSLDIHHLVTVYTQYLEIMHHYHTVLPNRVLDVSYEQLVANPEKIMRSVISRLKLDWDPKILEFYKTNRTVQTHSMAQVRHNISSKAIGGWRHYATQLSPMIEALRKKLKPMLAKGALPFSSTMNWKLDVNFAYGVNDNDMIKQNQKHKVNEKNAASSEDEDSDDYSSMEDMEIEVDGKSMLKSKKKRNKLTKTNNKKNNNKNNKKKSINKKKKKTTIKKVNKNKKSNSDKSQKKEQQHSSTISSNAHHQNKQASNSNKKIDQMNTQRTSTQRKNLGGTTTSNSSKLVSILRSLDNVADKSLVQQVMGILTYPTGDIIIDEIVAIGYILLNTQKVQAAVDLFQTLLAERDDLVSIYLGLGSALGLSQRWQESLDAFDKLLDLNPVAYEAYERRAEVYSTLGRVDDAIRDYNFVIENGERQRVLSSLIARGTLRHREKAFGSAAADFRTAEKMTTSEDIMARATINNMLGKCEREFANTESAIKYISEAIRLNPNAAEPYLNMAIAYIEASLWQEALPYFEKALQLQPKFKMVYGYRGLMYQNLGRSKDALTNLMKAVELDPNEPSPMLIAAACQHALGRLKEATDTFSRMLTLSPNHDCWFQREVAYYYYTKLDEDVSSFNVDVDMDIKVKEGWLQHSPWTSVFPSNYVSEVAKTAKAAMKKYGDQQVVMSSKAKEMLTLTTPLAKWVQLDTPGFMPNERQHRMFGLSVLQMAQLLRKHVRELLAGKEGIEVTDSSSSRLNWVGYKPSAKSTGYHVFGWRDLFDTVTRWRQVSEPLDAVWWNDKLSVKDRLKQLGLRTHIINGMNKVIRYYPYYSMAFNVTKSNVIDTGYYDAKDRLQTLTASEKKAFSKATTLSGLLDVVGLKALYVITPCYSSSPPGKVMDGTRLTLLVGQPEGHEFYINSPATPARDDLYAENMVYSFNRFIDALSLVLQGGGGGGGKTEASDAAFQRALEMFYYWVNYAPLSRGTSATGYAVLMACVVAMGEEILDPVPKGKQLDWEGILTPHVEDFVARVSSWFTHRGPTAIPKKWLDAEPGYDAREIFNTTRNMIAVLRVT